VTAAGAGTNGFVTRPGDVGAMPTPSNSTTARPNSTPHERWEDLPDAVWAVGIVVGFGIGTVRFPP